jgi:hypothetical protein
VGVFLTELLLNEYLPVAVVDTTAVPFLTTLPLIAA